MQAGSLAQSGPVQAWTATVLVDGVQRPVRGVSLDREISSDLPEQVAGVTGAQPATGRIDWAPLDVVSATSAHPWKRVSGWPPKSGAQVRVYVADSGTAWLVFTGKIDVTTGQALGAMSSSIVDDFDALQAPVSVPVIADRMPARIRPGEPIQPPVKTAVEPWHVAHEALAAAGYGVQTPALVGRHLLRVLMQGSVAPSMGYLAGWGGPVSLNWAKGYQYLASGATVTYDPAPQSRQSGESLRVYIKRHASAGAVSVTVNHVDGRTRRYRFSDVNATTSRLEVYGSSTSTPEQLLGSKDLPKSGSVETPWVDLFIRSAGSTQIDYATSPDYAGVGNFLISSASPETEVRTIQVTGGAVAVMAEYVWAADWSGQNFTNRDGTRVNAWGRGIIGSLTATRTIEKRKAVDVLSEIAGATLTGMWLDETGIMQWAPSNVMGALAPVKTVTTDTDIVALGWSDSALHTRSQVLVDMDLARVNLTRDYEVQVWPKGGSNRSLGPGETLEEFVEPGPGFEWIEPDMGFARAGAVAGETFTTGSWMGGIYLFAKGTAREDDVYAWAPTSWLTHVVEKLGMSTWLLRQTNATLTRDIILETAPAGTSLSRRWRSYPFPFVRARGEVEFTEATLTGASRGPVSAPVLAHDLAHWGTRAGGQAVADWLSARLATPAPVLDRVSILYDPRIQLGDKLTLRSGVLPGFDVDAVVIGKHEELGESQHMELTLRVTAARTTAATLADLEQHYKGKNLSALETAWNGATLTQFEAAPLSR